MGRQLDLLAATPISFDPGFADLRRSELADGAWVDHVPGWVRGHDQLFDDLERSLTWRSETRRMYDTSSPRRACSPASPPPTSAPASSTPCAPRCSSPRHPQVAHAPARAMMFRPDWRY